MKFDDIIKILLFETYLDTMFHEIDVLNINHLKDWIKKLLTFGPEFVEKCYEPNNKNALLYYSELLKLHKLKKSKGIIRLSKKEEEHCLYKTGGMVLHPTKYQNITFDENNKLMQKFPWGYPGSDIYIEPIKEYIKSITPLAYKNFIYFSELEYKLSQIQKYHFENLPSTVVHDIELRLDKLFYWLKELMIGIINFRILYNPSYLKSKKRNKNFDIKQEIELKDMRWDGIDKCIFMLNNAKTLKEKIIAITVTLNVWHDRSGLFCNKESGYYRKDLPSEFNNKQSYYPCDGGWELFTPEEFESINNKINHRKLDHELSRETY